MLQNKRPNFPPSCCRTQAIKAAERDHETVVAQVMQTRRDYQDDARNACNRRHIIRSRMSIINEVTFREEVPSVVPCLTVATEMVSNLFKRIDERGLGHLTITDPFLHYEGTMFCVTAFHHQSEKDLRCVPALCSHFTVVKSQTVFLNVQAVRGM